jgi:hypothetical protein
MATLLDGAWGWLSWQNLNEDRKGDPKGWPYHGRAWLHLNKGVVASYNFSWHLWSRFCGVSFKVRPDCEGTFAASVALPPFAFWFNVDARGWLRKLADKVVALQPSDMGDKVTWSGRELSLRVHDTAVWWNVWVCDHGWTSSRPRWRDGSFHPLGRNMRQGEPRVIEERDALIPMPERAYRATVRLEETRWGWTRLPRFLDKKTTSAEVKMYPGEEIPHRGDATFSQYSPAASVEDAVGRMVATVLKNRRR